MRDMLAPLEGKRCQFRARYVQTGNHSLTNRVTLLLTDVRNQQGHTLADHAWAVMPPSFLGLGIAPGDDIEFSALVYRYRRADEGEDFGLMTVLGVGRVGAAATIKQRNQGGGGLPAPRVDHTANTAVARADRPVRVAPQKNTEVRVIPADPDARWDLTGEIPRDLAQGQRWIARIDAEVADLNRRWPANAPGHRPASADARRRVLRERRKEINVALTRMAPRGSQATVTVPVPKGAPPPTSEAALERRRSNVEAILGGQADSLSLLRANYELVHALLTRLRELDPGWEDNTNRHLTREEATVLGFTRRYLQNLEPKGEML